jgi:P27 family predicted phage terminase small subunit
MAKPGRKPVPTHLRVLHGHPSGLRPMGEEPLGVGVLWAPPAWFDDERRAQWCYAVENAPPGLLTASDRETLVIWVCASVEHARAAMALKGEVVVEAKQGTPYQNPLLGVMNRQAMIMLRSGAEMGFSPASRVSIGRAGEPIQGRAGQIAGTPLAAYLAEKPDKLDE